MALVTVTGTAQYKCRDELGRIYYEYSDYTATADDAGGQSALISALADMAEGHRPVNCVYAAWQNIQTTPIAGGPPGTGRPVTVFFLVWCIDEDGNEYGPKTQTYDATTDEDIELVIANVDAIATAFCAGILIPGSPPVPMKMLRWQITAPLEFQYFRG